ncbi:MAG: GNAT family N-acetyltransferase [Oscillospiraceae bacterium]|jgi:GNAT superfamily N-acetyltransferase
MTTEEIYQIAMQQSAIELGCKTEDFFQNENKLVSSVCSNKARSYLQLPFSCQIVSYGSNAVASVSPNVSKDVKWYIDHYKVPGCFETPNINLLAQKLAPYGLSLCFMAEYFLPDVQALHPLRCDYEIRKLLPEDFSELYTPEWSNALSPARPQCNVLGMGAYHNGRLIGLAACTADCEQMWQIGIDVLPFYRRQGIASALTSRLALEILALEKVPFYCTAWSNLFSVRNAIKSGFRPAWVELTAKDQAFVERLNSTRK